MDFIDGLGPRHQAAGQLDMNTSKLNNLFPRSSGCTIEVLVLHAGSA